MPVVVVVAVAAVDEVPVGDVDEPPDEDDALLLEKKAAGGTIGDVVK